MTAAEPRTSGLTGLASNEIGVFDPAKKKEKKKEKNRSHFGSFAWAKHNM